MTPWDFMMLAMHGNISVSGIAWKTDCPISNLARYARQHVTTCGLIIADRSHHQVAGDQMIFITILDYMGMNQPRRVARRG